MAIDSAPAMGWEGSLDLACFEAKGHIYGINVLQIREIVRAGRITPLPRAPELIEGVLEVHDRVIPVIDLGHILHGECVEETPATRIAILDVEGLVLGLRVGSAVDVLAVTAGSVEDTPALACQAGYEAVQAVVRRVDEAPVLVLSLENLLARVYRSSATAAVEDQRTR